MQIFAAGWDYFVKGGIVMYPLLCCSLYAIAIGFERYLFYKKFDNGKQFTKQLCNLLEQGDWQQAKNLTDDTQGEVAKLATIVMSKYEKHELLESFVTENAERTLDKFENNLSSLGVIVTLSPVLGLLGTITGMISSFNNLNNRFDNPLAVTAGVSEALITTVFGLSVSIIAICLHTYFTRRLKNISLNIEEMSNALLEAIIKKTRQN